MQVEVAEVQPGLAVHLDTTVLRALGGVSTNAEISGGHDRAVQGPHYFLVTAIDDSAGTCTAVPLFSEWAPGSEKLDASMKTGSLVFWQQQNSHFSRWQHWEIPLTSVETASADEFTTPADRCYYALGDTAAFSYINSWIAKNRAPFRQL